MGEPGKYSGQGSVWHTGSGSHFQVMRTSEHSVCTLKLQRQGDSCRGGVSWGSLHRLCRLQREKEKPKASVHTHTHAHAHTHCSLESPDATTVPDNPHCHPSPRVFALRRRKWKRSQINTEHLLSTHCIPCSRRNVYPSRCQSILSAVVRRITRTIPIKQMEKLRLRKGKKQNDRAPSCISYLIF